MNSNIAPSHLQPIYNGVAVTIFMGSPKWFQNRYSLMVNQILAALPLEWVVQIFYIPTKKMSKEGLKYPGILKNIDLRRVIVTEIPLAMSKKKKNELMKSLWLWKSIVHENVLTFGGNAVLCSNSPFNINDFIGQFDYIGSPWKDFGGIGGNGGLSLRNRTKMLEVINGWGVDDRLKYDNKLKGNLREDIAFVYSLQKIGGKLATFEDTQKFAMSDTAASITAFGAVGTLASQNDANRQFLLDYCPEMKMMFPSLHNPSCFGAEPNAIECFKYLCNFGGLKCKSNNKASWFDKVNNSVSLFISYNTP
eukprot:gene15472-20876_t